MKRLIYVVVALAMVVGMAVPALAVEPIPQPQQGVAIVAITDIDASGNVIVMEAYGNLYIVNPDPELGPDGAAARMYAKDINATNGDTMYDQTLLIQELVLLPGTPEIDVVSTAVFDGLETGGLMSWDERIGIEVLDNDGFGCGGLCNIKPGCECEGCLAAAAGSSAVIAAGVIHTEAVAMTTSTPHLAYDLSAAGIGMASFSAMVSHGSECTQAICPLMMAQEADVVGMTVYMESDVVSGLFSIAKHFEVTSVIVPFQPTPFEWVGD